MDSNFSAPATDDAAVLAAIVSKQKTLVIRSFDPNKPTRKPLWKFPGGMVEWEEGESPYEALVREILEETGFLIPHIKRRDGNIVVGSQEVIVHHLSSPIIQIRGHSHVQHRFLVETRNELDILYLDGKTFKEGEDETIETRVFEFQTLLHAPDFLFWQNEMRSEVAQKLSELKTA